MGVESDQQFLLRDITNFLWEETRPLSWVTLSAWSYIGAYVVNVASAAAMVAESVASNIFTVAFIRNKKWEIQLIILGVVAMS